MTQRLGVDLREPGQDAQVRLSVDLDDVCGDGCFGTNVETELPRLFGDQRGRQDRGDVVLRLGAQRARRRERPEVALPGLRDRALNLSLARVVRREGQVPVAEHPVQIFQVRRGRARRFLGIGTLVDPGVDPKTVAATGLGDELEDPLRPRA